MDAVLALQTAHSLCHEVGKSIIALRTQIQRAATPGVGSQFVIGEIDRR